MKIGKNWLSYGGGKVMFFRYNLFSKRFFRSLTFLWAVWTETKHQSMGRLNWNKASINVEFNYLSNGGSSFIEIGHKFINLWLWSCHFLRLQLVYQNVFPLYWTLTFHSGVFDVSYINQRGIKISVEWKWFHWNWTKLIELWCWECHVFPLQLVFSKRFFDF
jgi:hypothetical protein